MIYTSQFFLLFLVVLFSVSAKGDFEFCRNYYECDSSFLAAAEDLRRSLPPDQKEKLEIGFWSVPSIKYSDLKIHYLYLPPTHKPENLFVSSTGVHGVEALIGNKVLRIFLKDTVPKMNRRHTGIFLIHCINPFGLRELRRVDEFNVDLGRNFVLNPKVFEERNGSYEKVSPFLNPRTKVNDGTIEDAAFYLNASYRLLRNSLHNIREAILQGQYHMPEGIYYGGHEYQPQKLILEKALLDKSAPYSRMLLLDIHSGFGKRGALHLMPNSIFPSKDSGLFDTVFKGFPLLKADQSYKSLGDFGDFFTHTLERNGKTAIAMILEFGTIDNLSHLGGMISLKRMVKENQMYHHGVRNPRTRKEVERDFLELFFPSDLKWRANAVKVSREYLDTIATRFSSSCAISLTH